MILDVISLDFSKANSYNKDDICRILRRRNCDGTLFDFLRFDDFDM